MCFSMGKTKPQDRAVVAGTLAFGIIPRAGIAQTPCGSQSGQARKNRCRERFRASDAERRSDHSWMERQARKKGRGRKGEKREKKKII
jgi:hypothetical protein